MDDQNYIPQTGFLYKLKPTDYITGASPLDIPEVMPSADWTPYVPVGEKQFKYATFDTFSCTTFSFLNEIETWVNWHKTNNHFTPNQLSTMNSLGFFADGKFNCSDRFTAITSGTMPNGNYFQNVADAVRNKGLLPEAILPFGGNNQLEYLDVSLITSEMFIIAKKILDILDISYEWTNVDTIPNSLKQCPMWIAIPEQASHAVEQINSTQYFDSYEPYINTTPTVKYAMKVVVKVKPETMEPPVQTMYKPKNFSLKELVSPVIYAKYGEKCWEFFDVRILKNIQWLREKLGVIRVNNYSMNIKYRGLDAYEFRKDGVSQHNQGRALDYEVIGKTPKEVTDFIVANQKDIPEPNVWIEKDQPHNHMDVRYSDKKGVYLFLP